MKKTRSRKFRGTVPLKVSFGTISMVKPSFPESVPTSHCKPVISPLLLLL
jgi:hypothetical protein